MNSILLRILQVVLPLVVLGAAGLVALTIVRNRPPVATQAPIFAPPGVRVHEVALEQVPMSVASQGTVRPRTESQLVPEIAGRITWVAPSFAEGGFFDVGDVLVKIDPFDYEQALVSARSQLAQSRLRLAQEEAEAEVAEREWADLGRGDPRELTLRKPQLDDARASVAAAEANVVRAERDLERAEIVAPYSGRIRQKNVDIGQFVRVGDPVATVYSVDVAEVRLPLPDDQIAYLNLPLSYRGGNEQPQPRVTLRATFAGETHEWQGYIVRTESEIDPVSRMVHVVAEVADPYAPSSNPNQPPLAVGMYVEAEIEGRTVQDVAVIPRAALRGQEQVLIVTENDRLSFQNIDVFRATTEAIFVRGGLTQGDLVVTSPLDTPTEGMTVQIADADPDLLAQRDAVDIDATERTPATPTEIVATTLPEITEPSSLNADAFSAEPRDSSAALAAAERSTLEMPPSEAEPPRPAWLDSLISDADESAPKPTTPEERLPQHRAPIQRAEASPTASANPLVEPNIPEPTVAEAIPPAATPREADPRAAVETEHEIAETSATPNAVTVTPFTNLNREGGNPALEAAVRRAIVDRLQTMEGVAMTLSETDAHYVINGGIQQVGTLVRVIARIVDATDGSVLRTLKVDGSTEDREHLEEQVAAAVIEHVDLFQGLDRVALAASIPALAILPFDNLSADSAASDDVDLGATITMAVTDRVSSVSGIKVVAADTDALWVVSGAVQRIGNVVRVTARLIDVSSGTVVHAIKVDGTLDGMSGLHEEVAETIADSVQETAADPANAAESGTAAIEPTSARSHA